MESMEMLKKLRKTIRRIAQQEARRQLRELYHNVISTLKTNPHNTFTGSASEYIRKYGLARILKQKIYQNFNV
jgi:hypothetical protein